MARQTRFLIEVQDFRDFFNWKLARGEKENWEKIDPGLVHRHPFQKNTLRNIVSDGVTLNPLCSGAAVIHTDARALSRTTYLHTRGVI